jgi:PAS domain S-box-containing protein
MCMFSDTKCFETATDGILLLDAESGEITDVNPFMVELLGYSRDQCLGKKLWDMGPFKDVEARQIAFRELPEKEFIRYEDLPLQSADGRRIDVEFVSKVYWAGDKKFVQCNIRDISRRRRAEEALRALNEELEQRRLSSAHSQADHHTTSIRSIVCWPSKGP